MTTPADLPAPFWIALSSDDLMALLRQVEAGADPSDVLARFYLDAAEGADDA